eukprot:TRINITY_DN26302_c0_g2_i1.p1 TRINITY_DN26302_c0_g2~~TRINITY_DN26302_c0_g2_i1.p1  ORF type:complete len:524 (-),score=65.68 TRINITY_DN26302_c0_g2_i1:54-1625(-)
MTSTRHPLDWSTTDVKTWLAMTGLHIDQPADMAGSEIWYLSQEELSKILPQNQGEPLLKAVQQLKQHFEDKELLDALRLQQEDIDDGCVAHALLEEHQQTLGDRAYGHIFEQMDADRDRVAHIDQELAVRLHEAWNRDDEMVDEVANHARLDEQQVLADSDLARCLADLGDGAAQVLLEEHGRSFVAEASIEQGATEEPSSSVAGGIDPEKTVVGIAGVSDVRVTCDVCAEVFSEGNVEKLGCEHTMCIPCLRKLYRNATSDVAMIPVRCCRAPLGVDLAKRSLDSAELVHFLRLSAEKLAKNKMFCANPTCSHFIDLDRFSYVEGSGELDCPSCAEKLCIRCKSSWHAGKTCAESQASSDRMLLDETAGQMGWKRCPSCTTYVNLRTGCNHMTCLCGHEFCFACLTSWMSGKTCDCPLWDERNLLEEGNRRERVAEERLGRVLIAQERHAIQRELYADNLAGRECNHRREGFAYREFAKARTKSKRLRECDNCENMITSFCYECNGCSMKFCHTCRFNRRLN